MEHCEGKYYEKDSRVEVCSYCCDYWNNTTKAEQFAILNEVDNQVENSIVDRANVLDASSEKRNRVNYHPN